MLALAVRRIGIINVLGPNIRRNDGQRDGIGTRFSVEMEVRWSFHALVLR